LKFDRSIQNPYYLWAVENLSARTAYDQTSIDDLKSHGTTFFNTKKSIECHPTGDTLLCSSTNSQKPFLDFYFKKLHWRDEHLVIETNSSCHKRNDRDRVEVAPFHNPTLNARASNHRDNVATCNYPNCHEDRIKNGFNCAVHQEQMGVYDAEVSPFIPSLHTSLTLYSKGRGDSLLPFDYTLNIYLTLLLCGITNWIRLRQQGMLVLCAAFAPNLGRRELESAWLEKMVCVTIHLPATSPILMA
jgi:hypothetical protein